MKSKVSTKVAVVLLIIFYSFPPISEAARSEPIIADHQAVQEFDQIPPYWIQQASEMFKIGYGHTSHGSQIISGMNLIRNQLGSEFSFYHPGSTRQCIGTGLCLFEGSSYSSGWLELDAGYWPTWRDETTQFLSDTTNSHFNVIMWSWCGQVSTATQNSMISNYLEPMTNFEINYPNVNFIYMTGHLDGTGVSGNLNLRNEQIRNYVKQHNKVLFDFADIESYDPGGNYYLDKGGRDDTGYIRPSDGVTRYWGIDYCNSSNLDQVYCASGYTSCSCAHSYCINCHMKGRAFWWLLARMAGWPGVEVSPQPTPTLGAGETGDLNGDGKIDYLDYQMIMSSFGSTYGLYDFNLVAASFGNS